jgi:hypothetical protein
MEADLPQAAAPPGFQRDSARPRALRDGHSAAVASETAVGAIVAVTPTGEVELDREGVGFLVPERRLAGYENRYRRDGSDAGE